MKFAWIADGLKRPCLFDEDTLCEEKEPIPSRRLFDAF